MTRTPALLAALLAACSSPPRKEAMSVLDWHKAALEATAPERVGTVAPGSPEEAAAVARFQEYWSSFTPERVHSKLSSVYAPDAWLDDTIKSLHGLDAIEAYMAESAGGAESCSVEPEDWTRKGPDFYMRWKMHVRFKKLKKGETTSTLGVTHLRFNVDGKVAYHQDYWDSARGIWEHVPVLGWAIRKIKAGL